MAVGDGCRGESDRKRKSTESRLALLFERQRKPTEPSVVCRLDASTNRETVAFGDEGVAGWLLELALLSLPDVAVTYSKVPATFQAA